MKNILFLFLSLAFVATMSSCDDSDPTPENPEELITTVRLVYREAGTMDEIIQEFRDLDGDGGNAPEITTNPLDAEKAYILTLEVLNESVSPTEDIAEEIKEEDDEHQFFFIDDGLNYMNTYNDQDDNGYPVGLENSVLTGTASDGTLTVILRHKPSKFAPGVSDGNITNAGGDTDVEIEFNLSIQ